MPEDVITVKPIIRELVRTQVCFPNVKLLVDRICLVKVPQPPPLPFLTDISATATTSSVTAPAPSATEPPTLRNGYILHLTDRDKTIQAVLRSRLHKPLLQRGKIIEGSIVVLKEYELARGKRVNGSGSDGGEVLYLKVTDLYAVGREERKRRGILVLSSGTSERGGDRGVFENSEEHEQGEHHRGAGARQSEEERGVDGAVEEDTLTNPKGSASKRSVRASEDVHFDMPNAEDHDQRRPEHPQKRGRKPEQTELDTDVFERNERPLRSISPIEQSRSKKPKLNNNNNNNREAQEQSNLDSENDRTFDASCHQNTVKQPASASNQAPPHQQPNPIIISPLASLTDAHKSKNQLCTVLALIVHVDPHTFKPPHMPRKRDLHLMDTSTRKRVVLSVFTDPVHFEPAVGTIALFRHLTTHDWDGGTLKAYPWLCEGREWYVSVDVMDDVDEQGQGQGYVGGGVSKAIEGVDERSIRDLTELRNQLLVQKPMASNTEN